MKEYKHCVRCGAKYEKQPWCRGKRWENSRYCGTACQRATIAGWNKGKKDWVTPEGRKKLAENGRRNLAKETPEQKKRRYENIIASRNANDIWTPPALGKKGALRKNVWLGNEATYNGKHRWIQKNWQKTGVCEDCEKQTKPFGKRKYGTEWANLDGEYDRDNRNAWKELCVPCHRKLDHDRRANN